MKWTVGILIFCVVATIGCNTAKTTKVYIEVGSPSYLHGKVHASKKVDDSHLQHASLHR